MCANIADLDALTGFVTLAKSSCAKIVRRSTAPDMNIRTAAEHIIEPIEKYPSGGLSKSNRQWSKQWNGNVAWSLCPVSISLSFNTMKMAASLYWMKMCHQSQETRARQLSHRMHTMNWTANIWTSTKILPISIFITAWRTNRPTRQSRSTTVNRLMKVCPTPSNTRQSLNGFCALQTIVGSQLKRSITRHHHVLITFMDLFIHQLKHTQSTVPPAAATNAIGRQKTAAHRSRHKVSVGASLAPCIVRSYTLPIVKRKALPFSIKRTN